MNERIKPNPLDKLSKYSKDEFKKEIIQHESSKPIVLNENEYADYLEKTLLHRFENGEACLKEAFSKLQAIAGEARIAENKEEFNLALELISSAVGNFQRGVVKHNWGWWATPPSEGAPEEHPTGQKPPAILYRSQSDGK